MDAHSTQHIFRRRAGGARPSGGGARGLLLLRAALTADGALHHTWGHGEGGKLGHGDEEEQATSCLVGAMEGCLI